MEIEIDLRILEVWDALNEVMLDDGYRELVASALRLAYGQGYTDALDENKIAEGELHRLITS